MKLFLAVDIITMAVFSGLAPLGATGNGHILDLFTRQAIATTKKGGKKNKRRSPIKNVDDKVTDKDIFEVVYPDGYKKNLIVENEDGENLHDDPAFDDVLDDDNDCQVVETAGKARKKKLMKEFFVNCEKCNFAIESNSDTHYTNGASHAKTCYGVDNLHMVNYSILLYALLWRIIDSMP